MEGNTDKLQDVARRRLCPYNDTFVPVMSPLMARFSPARPRSAAHRGKLAVMAWTSIGRLIARFPPMGSRGGFIAMLVLAAAWGGMLEAAAQEEIAPRFHGALANGQRLQGEVLHSWNDATATPRLGPHGLFDARNPVEWMIRDRLSAGAIPAAYVEFRGGDRLPGVVVGSAATAAHELIERPRALLVQPLQAYRRPNADAGVPLRVRLEHVRRIVWGRGNSTAPVPPGTAMRHDGSTISFRAVRWLEDSIALLTAQEILHLPVQDFAEIHLPIADPWEAYWDHAARLLPGGEGRLIQLETDDGLIALTSTARLRPETYGDNRFAENWMQIVQPAWSEDPLWVRVASIRLWRFFDPHEVPMSVLEPIARRPGALLSRGLVSSINQTARGELLTDGTAAFGWGFATPAPCELGIFLPRAPEAIALKASFGLAPVVGGGGLARVRVERTEGKQTRVLFESEDLVGTAPAQSTGRLALEEADSGDQAGGQPGGQSGEQPAEEEGEGPAFVRLVADPLFEMGPADGDPFDIRDAVQWYAPRLILDREQTRQLLRERGLSRMDSLAEWRPLAGSTALAHTVSTWSTRDWDNPRFRTMTLIDQGTLGLSRELSIPAGARYLAVLAHSPETKNARNPPPGRVQVRIDGSSIGELPIPVITGRREPDPLLFPIESLAGRTVLVEVFQLPAAGEAERAVPVEWGGVAAVRERPGLRNLLAEPFVDSLKAMEGLGWTIPPPHLEVPQVADWEFPIREEPALGEFRYARWVWSAEGSKTVTLGFGHGGVLGVSEETFIPPPRVRQHPSRGDDRGTRNGFRYLVGGSPSDAENPPPAIILGETIPQDPARVQRDLYHDFGDFLLTGLGVTTDAGPLRLRELWLARTIDQFQWTEQELAGPAQPNAGQPPVLWEAREAGTLWPLLHAVAPMFSYVSSEIDVALLATHGGREQVLRTVLSGGEAHRAGFMTAVVAPSGEETVRLRGVVRREGGGDAAAKILLRVNGELIETVELADASAATGEAVQEWRELDLEVAPVAESGSGRLLRVELAFETESPDGARFYWHGLRLGGTERESQDAVEAAREGAVP